MCQLGANFVGKREFNHIMTIVSVFLRPVSKTRAKPMHGKGFMRKAFADEAIHGAIHIGRSGLRMER